MLGLWLGGPVLGLLAVLACAVQVCRLGLAWVAMPFVLAGLALLGLSGQYIGRLHRQG